MHASIIAILAAFLLLPVSQAFAAAPEPSPELGALTIELLPEGCESPPCDSDALTLTLGSSIRGAFEGGVGQDFFFVFDLVGTIQNNTSVSQDIEVTFFTTFDRTVGNSDDVPVSGTGGVTLDESAAVRVEVGVAAPNEAGQFLFYVQATTTDGSSGRKATFNSAAGGPFVRTADLAVDAPSVDPVEVRRGQALRFETVVSNLGDVVTQPTQLRFYASSDSNVTMNDTELPDPVTVPALTQVPIAIGAASVAVDELLTIDLPAGDYFIGACVEPSPKESATLNNCSSGVAITVTEAGGAEPDLVLRDFAPDRLSVVAGAPLRLDATVANEGDTPSAESRLRFYRSTNATISSSDLELAVLLVPALLVDELTSQSVTINAPAAGTYFFGACVDSVDDENDISDNCSSGISVEVLDQAAQTPAIDLFYDHLCAAFGRFCDRQAAQ